MARKEVRNLARKIRKQSRDAARDHGGAMRYGEITSTKPLAVDVTDSSLQLDEEEIVLGQSVRQYDKDHGLAKGDTLALHLMRNGDWAAVDVFSDKAV